MTPSDHADSDTSHLSRLHGSLLGGAIGDALGAPVEFDSLDEITRVCGDVGVTDYLPAYGGLGRVTDDTQMTLLTCEAIRRALSQGTDVTSTTYDLYRDWAIGQGGGEVRDPWLRQHPMLLASRAPGNACLTGLTAPLRGTQDRRVNRQSKGCGTVMRSAPYGLVRQWTADECVRQSIAGSFLSHGHDTAAAAAAAFTLIIRLIIDGADVRSAALTCLDYLPRLVAIDTSETCTALTEACQAALTGAPTSATVTSLGEGWVAEEALAIGLFAALVHGDDITAALTLAVTHSGDSDSTGSICGNLLGAAHGLGKLPEDLATRNEAALLITELAPQLG